MKVLFAVSNEEISESIIKKYQKEYKQIISYKNVYYFNAILKELQKDKTYDRIVISEDLEAFTHTQYEQIDKFIFEKLDSISDEASNLRGNDTPIILICSDRRTKSEPMLVKLFGIGVYNAIIGNDRSVDEVCRLINRPRVKKEAKAYYKIDTEDVNYQSENENDVSEMEIQNIVAHYKRLGKNEDRFVDSFNNIAAQYNDTQLRIITKFLPLNVRAVLEEKSTKYQQIMSFNNSISDTLHKKSNDSDDDEDNGPSQVLLKSKTRDNILSKPVVIPSAVNMSGTKKLARQKPVQVEEIEEDSKYVGNDIKTLSTEKQQYTAPLQQIPETKIELNEQKLEQIEQMVETMLQNEPEEKTVKRGRGRPKKVVNEMENNLELEQQPEKRKRGRPKKVKNEEQAVLPGFRNREQEEPGVLPGFDDEEPEGISILPGFDEVVPEETSVSTRFNEEEPEETSILPGFDEEEPEETNILPGFDEEEPEETNILPGFGEEEPEETNILPGFDEEESEESDILPGFEEIEEDNVYEKQEIFRPTTQNNRLQKNNNHEVETETIDLSNLLTPDKKIVTFVGTSKNGTSFIVNNIAQLMSAMGINTAILDTTQNRNSYYIYTKNEEQLRQIATHSIEGLAGGVAKGISINRNLTVYTSLPNENEYIENVDKILETLLKSHSLILIDTDFETPSRYFKQSQETYLVQSMDILTIQPLTAFLKELKMKNVLEEKKLRIVLNKNFKLKGIKNEAIIGGIAFYNDPAMSFMTELFDRDRIKYVSIPFEDETYIRYLEGIIDCEISLKGYSKIFMQTLRELGNMIYPIVSTSSNNKNYQPPSASANNFSPSINNTLDKMKKGY